MTLGDKLSRLRKENNYTQEQLANILGVSRQAVSKWESDITWPETDKLIRICKLFDCTTDYLLLEEDMPKRPEESAQHPRKRIFCERKSEQSVKGIPLWHIGRDARAVVAVGLRARGVIAIGLRARGIFSLGLLSAGILSFGMLSFGLLAVGMFALGVLSAGSISIGFVAMGAVSLGMISLGAVAIGDFSFGALAVGKYFACGDCARAMIAIGDSQAAGSVFQKTGELTAQETSTVKELLDTTVPAYLSWAKELIKWFL